MPATKKGSGSKHTDRKVRKQGDYIVCKYVGTYEEYPANYFTYNDELMKILRLKKLGVHCQRAHERIEFRIRDNKGGEQIAIAASHLAYGCYHGMIREKTLISDLKAWKEHCKTNGLVIDHLDDNPNNNTTLNLSVMTRAQNGTKQNIVAKIKEPNACMLAYVGGEYRVRLYRRTNLGYAMQEYFASPERRAAMYALSTADSPPHRGWIEERYICRNADELLACLHREAVKNHPYTWPLKVRKGHINVWRKTFSNEYWGDDIKYALECQSAIASMDWSDAKLVMALHRGKQNKYLKYLKGRVKGLALKALPFGIYKRMEENA